MKEENSTNEAATLAAIEQECERAGVTFLDIAHEAMTFAAFIIKHEGKYIIGVQGSLPAAGKANAVRQLLTHLPSEKGVA